MVCRIEFERKEITQMLYVFKDSDKYGTFFDTATSVPSKCDLWFGPFETAVAETVRSTCQIAYRSGADDKLAQIRELLGVPRK